jgi:hypothetical protein
VALAEAARSTLVIGFHRSSSARSIAVTYPRSAMSRRRTIAVVVVVAAALALGWTSSRVWGPAVFGSERPSITIDHGSGTDDAAVVQRGSSIVRTFVGDRPSPSRDLRAALGLAAIATAAFWTRRRTEDRWTHRPLHPLRGTVALRAPPSSRLF